MGVFDFIRDAGSKILKGSKEEKFEAAREAADKARARAESSGAADKARSARSAAQKRASRAAEQAGKARERASEQAEKAREKAAAAREAAAAKQAQARAAFEERRAEAKKSNDLEDYVSKLGLGDDIDVRFDDGVAYVSGSVPDQDTLERVVLAVGNVEGVERVDEDLEVVEPADAARLYTVEPGDTLSAIAQRFYGDANRYSEIFEANRPMLSDPNLIYPGQVLRIP